MLLRALIVVLAYVLSGAGFMFMLVGAFPFLGGEFALFAKLVQLLLLVGGSPASTSHHLSGAFITIGLVSVFFLPSILLAVHLVRFHLQAQGQP